MCTAKTIPTENPRVSPYFRWREAERDRLSIQIAGENPEVMAAAACRIRDEGLFGVDINFGCSVSAITCRRIGAALLKDPAAAEAIVRAVRKAVDIPVTVKYRTGWRDDPAPAVEMARRFEQAGADALTFHPRVAPDRRSRPPRWEYIAHVKSAVTIPVFGNGDVFTAEDCRKMLECTGCDGVAVGRMAVARPWIFAQWCRGYRPSADIFAEAAFGLMRLLPVHFDPRRALRRMKKFCYYFSANFRFGHLLFSRVQNASGMADIERALKAFFDTPPETNRRPNLNFFR
jgi:nifR3 family TIM-barrel protein